jgi:hypothetical protein
MTELRDARFKRALQDAPDAQLGPQEATRRAVHEAAARAVQTQPAQRKWRWWPAPRQRMPWNAAFATVLLASLVALLWQGRDVPDARTDTAAVDPQVPSVAPAPVPAPASAPSVAVERSPPQAARKPQPADAAARQEREARRASAGLHKSAPQDLARQREAAAPLHDSATPSAAPTPAPPPPAPAAAAQAPRATAPAAPAAELSARSQAVPGWQQWSQLRISGQGAAVTVPREREPQLAGLIERVAAGATADAPLHEAPQWRLELGREGLLLAVLEVAGDQVRWSAPGSAARTGRPDAAALQALREELQRLAPR